MLIPVMIYDNREYEIVDEWIDDDNHPVVCITVTEGESRSS